MDRGLAVDESPGRHRRGDARARVSGGAEARRRDAVYGRPHPVAGGGGGNVGSSRGPSSEAEPPGTATSGHVGSGRSKKAGGGAGTRRRSTSTGQKRTRDAGTRLAGRDIGLLWRAGPGGRPDRSAPGCAPSPPLVPLASRRHASAAIQRSRGPGTMRGLRHGPLPTVNNRLLTSRGCPRGRRAALAVGRSRAEDGTGDRGRVAGPRGPSWTSNLNPLSF
ncbi:hypothetical protein THAOC_31817 [Thalassiosira oceanica]|uniref:Uncharacterized protein n=1 Tax=Thalassiosira oceanica TaxID=159749 RepID=K0R7C2_THAOC|nr:hypothetical protein THAOC_31817 [Thalassiosira oceanica]|eukprot:EJK49318.1 hypothetical protein THAOC_31817 [Thalassiosira oceanica]